MNKHTFLPIGTWTDDWKTEFMAKVGPVGERGCRLWLGGCDGQGGYGRFRRRIASRVALFLKQGYLTPGMSALHTCDNPPCVEFGHIYEGSHAVNMKDIAARRKRHLRVERVTVLMSAPMAARLDKYRGAMSRSAYVRAATRSAMRRQRKKNAIDLRIPDAIRLPK